MAKFDLDWLLLFDALCETRSVSAAAKRLGIAQGTASIILNKLRAHFNDPLFTRTSKGMEPTPFARDVRPDLANALELLTRARSGPVPFEPSSSTRRFRIGISDYCEIDVLPPLLNALYTAAPRVEIETETIAPETARRLEAGEIDLAIGFLPQLEAGFFQQRLFGESFVCIAARRHPRITGTRLTKKAYFAERHVMVPTRGTGHVVVRRVIEEQKIPRSVALRLPSFLGLARIVAQTELLAIVPRTVADTYVEQERIKILNLPFDVPDYVIMQHWHARFHADAGNVWLRRLIARLFLEKEGARTKP